MDIVKNAKEDVHDAAVAFGHAHGRDVEEEDNKEGGE